MNVVDSSGWLEYFADEPNADFFAPAIENKKELIVPAISIYEVFKRVYQQRGENDALKAVAQMLPGQVIEFDTPLALRAAKVSIDFSLPMAGRCHRRPNDRTLSSLRLNWPPLWVQSARVERNSTHVAA